MKYGCEIAPDIIKNIPYICSEVLEVTINKITVTDG